MSTPTLRGVDIIIIDNVNEVSKSGAQANKYASHMFSSVLLVILACHSTCTRVSRTPVSRLILRYKKVQFTCILE